MQEIVDTCDFFLGEGRRLYGQTVPSEMRDKQLFTFRVPVGVAGIITAGNFPVAVPSWYLVPALLCGNAVVWKPADYAAALGDALTRLFVAGGLPAGRAQHRPRRRRRRPSTGSSGRSMPGAGRTRSASPAPPRSAPAIGELCGRHLQSPCLELGGKNPLVVMPDADLDLAAEGALFSGFGTAGQRCTSLGVVIAHEDVHDAFLERFLARVRGRAGRRPEQDVLYGPMLSERFLQGWEKWLGEVAAPPHGARRHRPDHLGQPARGLRRRPGRRGRSPTRSS